jgi:transketolase
MPIIDSKTGIIKKDYTVEELVEKAKEMRAYNMVAITAAGSGHTGGTLSIMDVTAALYLKEIKHDPANPDWEDRDRVFWSVGHKAPALYVALGETLGVAVGCALNARLEKKDYWTFCILGDGELDEGSIWESAMSAAHYKLDNLIAIVDRNNLQIDGPTKEVMQLESMVEKWQSFGWHTIEIDGHDMTEILKSFEKAKTLRGKPTVIIAHTVKGKGVSYTENVVGYHGVCPKDGRKGAESLEKALQDIKAKSFDEEKVDALFQKACAYQEEVNQKIDKAMPKFSRDYWWNKAETMKVKMVPTRNGFGDAIAKLGEAKSVVAFGADITNSICMNQFYENHPERKERFFQMGRWLPDLPKKVKLPLSVHTGSLLPVGIGTRSGPPFAIIILM